MNILNKDIIIQRIKADADLIAKNCEFDVQESVSNQLRNVETVDVATSVKLQKPLFQKMLMPFVGVAVLTLVVFQFVLTTQTIEQNPSNIQLLDNKSNLITTNPISIKSINNNIADEKLAIKEDILYLSQVFSM